MTMDERLYWLWLAGVLGYAAKETGTLLDVYGDAEGVFLARDFEDFSTLLRQPQIQRMHTLEPESFAPVLARCDELGIQVVTWADQEYPMDFLRIPDAPPVLYCTGDIAVLNHHCRVSMVGSRRPSVYGVEAARVLADGLAEAGVILVSGLADGLDSEAHKASVRADAETIAVLGNTIDETYPPGNRGLRAQIEQRGVVISEYGPGAGRSPNFFLQRNRLIAALGDVLCVVEARQKSGTMSTVHHARRYGRRVYAVPGSIFSNLSEGTNQLIADEEARPVLNAATLLRAIGRPPEGLSITRPAGGPVPPTPEDAAVLEQFGARPMTFDALYKAAGLGVGELLAALTRLGLGGHIVALAGRRYQRR